MEEFEIRIYNSKQRIRRDGKDKTKKKNSTFSLFYVKALAIEFNIIVVYILYTDHIRPTMQ